MKIPRRVHPVASLVLLALTTACSGNAGTATPTIATLTGAQTMRAASQQASTSYVYACTAEPKCLVFGTDGTLVRTLKKNINSPLGLATDPDGNVYMAQEGAHQVAVYAPGMASLTKTLDTGNDVPLDVAVYDGTVAVSDEHAVTVFAPGSSSPSRLTDSAVLQGTGIAFDSQGNCYWSFSLNNGNGSTVDEFVACAGKPKRLGITGAPASLAFDGNDNLYYANDTFEGSAGIYKCAGVANCAVAFAKDEDPEAIRFDSGWQNLYADDIKGHTISRIDVTTGKIVQTFRRGFTGYLPPVGIAVGPGPG